MFIDYKFWGRFIFWGKVAGGFMAFGSAAAFLHSKLVNPIFKRVKTINETVTALATNHLPHIQKSLDDQDVVLRELETNVRAGNEKIEQFGDGLRETKESVATLHNAFLQHLNNVSKESAPKKKAHASRQ